jgi:hypothetical protein
VEKPFSCIIFHDYCKNDFSPTSNPRKEVKLLLSVDNIRQTRWKMADKHSNFPGTYFNRDIVLRIASAARVFAWIVAGFYAVQWVVQAGVYILQIARGLWPGMGFTDYARTILGVFEPSLRGLVYFIVLQGVAQALLLFMDMEDNTRRAARGKSE